MKKTAFDLPFRQIHLDFHTGPWIKDVGRDFDAREFARTMQAAHVNSVTVFAKCHHGHLYYNTRRPERHPGLKPGLDLLGRQVKALHAAGIRAPIYISVQCDNHAARMHPEWVARGADGRNAGAQYLEPGWQTLDMNSPYQEYLAEQVAEVLEKYRPVDGIFFDMCWDQPSTSTHAIAAMTAAGLDPASEADRATHAHRVALAYMDRFFRQVKRSSPDATVYFNSRPLGNLAEESPFLSQVEIECLPTGGWGYTYFPRHVRSVRTFGRPYMGMTARFHKSWADFGGLKPEAALEYETAQMLAHGARCSIGDQLHPRGTLDRAAYALIGKVYARVERREAWVRGARPLADIGLFPSAHRGYMLEEGGAETGAVRMLTQLRCQFDVVDPGSCWEDRRLIVLPDAAVLDAGLVRRLKAYLKKGGKLLATGLSGLNAEGTRVLLPELGLAAHGMSPFTTTYFRFRDPAAAGAPDTDHVMYERGVRVTPKGRARAVAAVVEPYFERTWAHFSSHCQTPPDRATRYAAAVLTRRTAFVAYPVFGAFARHGNYPYRLLVGTLLDALLSDPLLCAGGPTGLETTVTRRGGATVVHLLYCAPERRTPRLDLVEDVVPLRDLPVSLRLDRKPASVRLEPEGRLLAFTWSGGRAEVVVPELRGHQMVVFTAR